METKMKTKFFILGLVAIAFTFSSCDPTTDENSTKNYWEQNSLVRLQLKGKVKTVTETSYDTEVTQFNENGFITSMSQTGTGYSSSTTYTYLATGELNKTVTVSTNTTSPSTTNTTTYEYDTHGKYVASFAMHLYEAGLVPNLKAIINTGYRMDYKFEGDNLLIISTNTVENFKDTSIIKYSGKYPVSASDEMHFMKDITYADNGMFKTYTEGFTGPNYRDSRIYTFKTDAEYQLKESVSYVSLQGVDTRTESETFTYNDKKDLIKIQRGTANVTNIVYEYDSQNNWTKRTSTSTYENSTEPYVELITRSIVYWTDVKTAKN